MFLGRAHHGWVRRVLRRPNLIVTVDPVAYTTVRRARQKAAHAYRHQTSLPGSRGVARAPAESRMARWLHSGSQEYPMKAIVRLMSVWLALAATAATPVVADGGSQGTEEIYGGSSESGLR